MFASVEVAVKTMRKVFIMRKIVLPEKRLNERNMHPQLNLGNH
jgi:hypothetical protein